MLFDDFDAWLKRNPEVWEQNVKEFDGKVDCIACENERETRHCKCCGGTGVVDNPFLEDEVMALCRREYCEQLERDYRNALHLFCAA